MYLPIDTALYIAEVIIVFHATFHVIMYSRRKKCTMMHFEILLSGDDYKENNSLCMTIGYLITRNFATASIYCTVEKKKKYTMMHFETLLSGDEY